MNARTLNENMMKSIFDGAAVIELVRRLSTPFDKTPAFKAGLIDAKGNYLKPRSKMTKEERQSFTLFDLLIFNLKKIMAKTTGSANFTPFVASMLLLKEHIDDLSEDDIAVLAETMVSEVYPEHYSMFLESEAPVNVSAAEPNPPSEPKNINYPDVIMGVGVVVKKKRFAKKARMLNRRMVIELPQERFSDYFGDTAQ